MPLSVIETVIRWLFLPASIRIVPRTGVNLMLLFSKLIHTWLRIMADHAKFIGHLLDPSERQLVEQSRNFSHDFDQLLFQARDLESMRPQSQTVPLLDQFLDQNRISVKSLRDFKKTAKELIESCRIKSIIHPLLADHVFREAERFLFIIDMLESSLTKTSAG